MKQQFANGFGVSVISTGYGSEDGLKELAVIAGNELHYNNEVAGGDVRGYLTVDEVTTLTNQVRKFAKYINDDDIYYNIDGTTTGKDQE